MDEINALIDFRSSAITHVQPLKPEACFFCPPSCHPHNDLSTVCSVSRCFSKSRMLFCVGRERYIMITLHLPFSMHTKISLLFFEIASGVNESNINIHVSTSLSRLVSHKEDIKIPTKSLKH